MPNEENKKIENMSDSGDLDTFEQFLALLKDDRNFNINDPETLQYCVQKSSDPFFVKQLKRDISVEIQEIQNINVLLEQYREVQAIKQRMNSLFVPPIWCCWHKDVQMNFRRDF